MSNLKISTSNSWQMCLVFCLVAVTMVCPVESFAAADASGLTTALCKVVTMLTGTVGQAIAMIALVALGVGIFLGKLSWPLALATAVGITFIFSAGKIVGWISGGAAATC
jgi:type IV secretory pathway VirB2 component (pilin)